QSLKVAGMPGGLKRLWMLNRVNCDVAERLDPHIGRCNLVVSSAHEGYSLLIRHVDAITELSTGLSFGRIP
ncbi:MAG: hypothetical protein ACYSR1_08825, partial [Planctomycetota bacterium]